MSQHRIIRLTEALERTGFTRSTWYRQQDIDPDFPRPIKLAPRCIGYLEEEVVAYIDHLIAKRSR